MRAEIYDYVRTNVNTHPYVAGEFKKPAGKRESLSVIDPYTLDKICSIDIATRDDFEASIAAAETAVWSNAWGGLHPRARATYLYAIADHIEKNIDLLAKIESLDTGKKLSGTSAWDIPNAAEVFRYYAGWADKLAGQTMPPIANHIGYSRVEPVGVVAAILPWNFPFACLAWKVAPALAAGCSVIIKPAERAPLSAQVFGQVAESVGLPTGVLSILQGRGAEIGKWIAEEKRVDVISFTGGTDTGKELFRNSADVIRPLILELGGKSANVVEETCDLEIAVSGAISAMYSVSGQDCLAGSRTFVHESIIDTFIKKLIARIQDIKLGDNFDLDTDQGPQIDLEHSAKIMGFIDRARDERELELLTGGKHPKLGKNFIEPTLFLCRSTSAELYQKEVFGPVSCLIPYQNFDELLVEINNVDYGLAAAIWSTDREKIEKFQVAARAGTVWVNTYGMIDSALPWGGVKRSGIGYELGKMGIEQFVRRKSVFEKF